MSDPQSSLDQFQALSPGRRPRFSTTPARKFAEIRKKATENQSHVLNMPKNHLNNIFILQPPIQVKQSHQSQQTYELKRDTSNSLFKRAIKILHSKSKDKIEKVKTNNLFGQIIETNLKQNKSLKRLKDHITNNSKENFTSNLKMKIKQQQYVSKSPKYQSKNQTENKFNFKNTTETMKKRSLEKGLAPTSFRSIKDNLKLYR